MLVSVDSLGFHFHNNGKFTKHMYIDTHITANKLIQVVSTTTSFGLFTMKPNNVQTNNEEWKHLNKYIYCSDTLQATYGSVHQYPSWVGNKYLQVFMLKLEVAEQFLKSDVVYLSKFEYKDISTILKSEYLAGFKYEYIGKKLYELPTDVPQKQLNNLVKVGTQLVQKPMRKIS